MTLNDVLDLIMSTIEILLFAILVALFILVFYLMNIWGDNNYWQYRSRLEKLKKLKEDNNVPHLEKMTYLFERSLKVSGGTFMKALALSLIFSSLFFYIIKYIYS